MGRAGPSDPAAPLLVNSLPPTRAQGRRDLGRGPVGLEARGEGAGGDGGVGAVADAHRPVPRLDDVLVGRVRALAATGVAPGALPVRSEFPIGPGRGEGKDDELKL